MDSPWQRENLIKRLVNGILVVKFTKTDGSERLMKCTLKPELLPPPPPNPPEKQTRVRKFNDTVLSVWDVEKAGWRSFRLDSLLSVDDYKEESIS